MVPALPYKIDNAVKEIDNETQILKSISHPKIISIDDGGVEGKIVSPNGYTVDGLHYLELEYVPGGHLLDLYQNLGAQSEDIGRYFMR